MNRIFLAFIFILLFTCAAIAQTQALNQNDGNAVGWTAIATDDQIKDLQRQIDKLTQLLADEIAARRVLISGGPSLKVRCPICKAEGKRSKCYQKFDTSVVFATNNSGGFGDTIWTPCYDEDGNIIPPPQPAPKPSNYRCTNGHDFTIER